MDFIKQKLSTLPRLPGVYLMKDAQGSIIYIGKAKNLKNRVNQYFFNTQKLLKVQNMVDKIVDLDYFIVKSENDALALESTLIKKHQPFYNILLKDNKAFQYIKVDLRQAFPRFEITRKLGKTGKYFGPYFAGVKASEILNIINYAYPLIKCTRTITEHSLSTRPCLFHDMHLCSAPCAHLIAKEDYGEVVQSAIKFLHGDTTRIEPILQEKMALASENMNFETAIKLRDAINMLDKLKTKVITQLSSFVSYDIFNTYTFGEYTALCAMVVRGGKLIGINTYTVMDYALDSADFFAQFLRSYYDTHAYNADTIILPIPLDDSALVDYVDKKYGRKPHFTMGERGIKRELLEVCKSNAQLHLEKNIVETTRIEMRTSGALSQLQKCLSLDRYPQRIECFDISNNHGTDTVASMSVLIGGEKAPSHYRKFKINTVAFIDDFASMREVLDRRMSELKSDDISFSNMPDLILIDGGKGQLSAAISVREKYEVNVEIISLAERIDEVFSPKFVESVKLPAGSYALRVLQLARDEAHRTAITYNRMLRNKSSFKGGLLGIDNIGTAARRKLLGKFITIERIKNATLEELSSSGLNKRQVTSVYEHFHAKKEI